MSTMLQKSPKILKKKYFMSLHDQQILIRFFKHFLHLQSCLQLTVLTSLPSLCWLVLLKTIWCEQEEKIRHSCIYSYWWKGHFHLDFSIIFMKFYIIRNHIIFKPLFPAERKCKSFYSKSYMLLFAWSRRHIGNKDIIGEKL